MKSKKGTPSAKGSKTANVTPVTQGSKNLKATPSAKIVPVTKAVPASKPKTAKALPVNKSAPQDGATPTVAHSSSEVAARAYLNYQKRGSTDGDHTDDWLRAEAELTAERRLMRK